MVVVFWFTTCDTGAEVTVLKPASPAYTAVMLWVPSARAEVAKLATPPDSVPVRDLHSTIAEAHSPPFVGTPLSELAVAVNVTNCPAPDGFTDDTTPIVLVALLTVRFFPALLAALFTSAGVRAADRIHAGAIESRINVATPLFSGAVRAKSLRS